MQRKDYYIFLFLLIAFHSAWSQKVFFSGNDDNSIFICEDGRIFMSGENNVGQLGNGTFVPSNVPVEVGSIDGVGSLPRCKQTQIEGVSTFLALTNSGDTVIAWGPNQFGQVGDGTTDPKTFPVRVRGVNGVGYLQNIIQIATGNGNGYGLTEDGKVVSWGSNSFGQTGTGTFNTPVLYPEYVLKAPGDTLKNVQSISAGGVFCLALLCDGSVWAWGRNNVFQLGQNTTVNSEFAIPVKNSSGAGVLSNIQKIEAGDNSAYALSSTDTLWVWGPNWDGRLGTGTGADHPLPTYVRNPTGTAHLSGVLDVASGQGHSLALLSDQNVYSWGINEFGQLGKNDTLSASLPVRVKDPTGAGFLSDVNYIAVGDKFSMVRTSANDLYLWGENTLGQLGLNDHIHRHLPVLLNLPCEPTPDIFPGTGTMTYPSAICIGSNSGNVYLNRNHLPIIEWQQSFDNFSTFTTINSTEYSVPYINLNRTAYYRVVLGQCNNLTHSPIAVLSIDSITQPGTVLSSATVRIHKNQDTLHLSEYKGSVIRWEFSNDNFTSDINLVNTTSSALGYSNLFQTTYYRVLVQQGVCPAAYSDTAEIRTIDQTSIKVYNGFTPDGDNYNDDWIIDFIDLFPDNRVEIYNRWGQPVFRISRYDNTNNVWQGENNVTGTGPLADGTYFYVIDPGEGNPVLKGYVVINR